MHLRRIAGSVVSAALALPALVFLPATPFAVAANGFGARTATAAHPVAPSIQRFVLTGVDAAALTAGSLRAPAGRRAVATIVATPTPRDRKSVV
jgi:hypothetical protein